MSEEFPKGDRDMTDAELNRFLQSEPPPPDSEDPKDRVTQRTCPCCKGEGLVSPTEHEHYLAMVKLHCAPPVVGIEEGSEEE